MNKSWHLHRRTFLQSAGISISLPLLHGMFPTMTQAAKQAVLPTRLLCVNVHLGFYADAFFPKKSGTLSDLPKTLKPLRNLTRSISVFSGLEHPKISNGHSATVNFLTGVSDPQKKRQMSLDQVAAAMTSQYTQVHSLQMLAGRMPGKGGNIVYGSDGKALPLESNPRAIFNRLFAKKKSAQEIAETSGTNKSILDFITEEAASLKTKLGNEDQAKVAEYLDSVRAVEKQIQQEEKYAAKQPTVAVSDSFLNDEGKPTLFEMTRQMYTLAALTFQADISRVVAININSARLGLAGVNDEYHSLSHHGNRSNKVDQLTKVDQAHITELARLLDGFSKTKDGADTMLDKTLVLFGSGMGNAAAHKTSNLPVIVAGGGLRHGQHHKFGEKDKTPLGDLFVTLLQRMGLRTQKFSTSRGSMNRILT